MSNFKLTRYTKIYMNEKCPPLPKQSMKNPALAPKHFNAKQE
jgi:hypothetical protein